MKKNTFLTLSLAVCAAGQMQAQIVPDKGGKLDFGIERTMRNFERARLAARGPVADVPVTRS